jgi:hypothetical protein
MHTHTHIHTGKTHFKLQNIILQFLIFPLTWLHCSAPDPTGSQSQASQPIPLAIFQWFSLHWSQFKPITFGLQEHCPVLRLHEPASASVPNKLHVHSARNNPLHITYYVSVTVSQFTKLENHIKYFIIAFVGIRFQTNIVNPQNCTNTADVCNVLF